MGKEREPMVRGSCPCWIQVVLFSPLSPKDVTICQLVQMIGGILNIMHGQAQADHPMGETRNWTVFQDCSEESTEKME